jgi:hypothetical protein
VLRGCSSLYATHLRYRCPLNATGKINHTH